MTKFISYTILVSTLILTAGNAEAKLKKPEYGSYVLRANNGIFASQAKQQTYRVFFITPRLRQIAYDYASQAVAQRVEKQKMKNANNPTKLSKELEEDKYQEIRLASWDHSQDLQIAVVPSLRVVSTRYGTYYYSNKQSIETVALVDEAYNLICSPKQELQLDRNHSYFERLYLADTIIFGGNNLDVSMASSVYVFAPECLKKDNLRLLIKNYSAKAAELKIKSKVAAKILNDFGITQ